jgi:uncharacterized FlgJ-related protein
VSSSEKTTYTICYPTDLPKELALPPIYPECKIKGVDLAKIQIEKGLIPEDIKNIGIYNIEDKDLSRKTKILKELVNKSNKENTYIINLIEYLSPFTKHIEDTFGIPSEVVLSQIILESGWGGSNQTIMNNNILGIKNSRSQGIISVTLDFGDHSKEIKATYTNKENYFYFDNIEDCIYFYVYILLQSSSNKYHYEKLREYIETNKNKQGTDKYRDDVLRYISISYNPIPNKYEKQVKSIMGRMSQNKGDIK